MICKDCGGQASASITAAAATASEQGLRGRKHLPASLQEEHLQGLRGHGYLPEHNRQRSRCKDCGPGGASICQHNRRRSDCKDCGGASICQQNRQRSRCTDRGDASALAGHLRNGWVYVSSVQAGGTAPWNDTSIRTKCFTLTTLCGIMVPLWCRERRCIRHTWVLLSRCIREV